MKTVERHGSEYWFFKTDSPLSAYEYLRLYSKFRRKLDKKFFPFEKQEESDINPDTGRYKLYYYHRIFINAKGFANPEVDAFADDIIEGRDAYANTFNQTEDGQRLYPIFEREIIKLREATERCKIDEIKAKLAAKQEQERLKKIALMELEQEGVLFQQSHRRPPIPKDVADFVYRRDGGKCVYCGSTENLQFDHIIPYSKGGATTAENLQILCQSCNLKKSNNIG